MNQTKLNYAMKRIEGLEKDKIAALKEKHTKKGTTPSEEEFAQMIKEGMMEMRDDFFRVNRYTDAYHIFDFDTYHNPDQLDKEKFEKEGTAVRLKANRIRDQIMLGDEQIALALIQQFAEEE